MATYLTSAIASFLISLALTGFLASWAVRRGYFTPEIRERDVHQQPVPRIGGIAIVLTFLLLVLFWQLYRPAVFDFIGLKWLGVDRNLLGVLLAVLLLSVVNVIDDYRGLAWPVKLLSQIAAGLIVVGFGIRVPWISNPFGGQLLLKSFDVLLVVAWLATLSNVTNWLDGLNGLAGGVSLIALVVLFFLSLSPEVGQRQNALLAAIAGGAVLGFLPYNLGRSKAFLGDTGSVFLGFLIGIVAIISGGKIATAFLVLAIPFLDAAVVVASRLLHHQSPFKADKRHLHHRLLALGWQRWQIVLLFYAVSLSFGLIALHTQTLGKVQAMAAALVLMLVLVWLYTMKGVDND